jgi:glycosyltransferase involved in cell wall biosynthesis
MPERVSVIATVLNEAGSIGPLLQSLSEQTRPPDEVVIVDGGSSDGTLETLHAMVTQVAYPLRVLSRPGANISAGRNDAITAAQGPLIAVTDAGVRLDPTWLERLLAPFEGTSPPDVVSGFFVPDPHSLFELVLGAVTLPLLEEIDPERFYPSSRSVAFRRSAWEAAGGYPEWLDYCEDLLFDFALRDAGYRFAFAPDAVAHFRPRPDLRAYCRQYYRYARGDGKADFWRYRHLARYATYGIIGPALVGLALAHHPIWWAALVLGLAAMLRAPLRRLWPRLRGLAVRDQALALLWAPVIRWTGDAAKMMGYPVGVYWRLRHAPPQPWPKRQR